MQDFSFPEEPVLSCRDHTVSGETFELRKEHNLNFLKTFPQPDERDLGRYYESEKYISHTDSKRTFLDNIYRGVKNIMLQKKLSWIDQYSPKGKLLDLGAGTGDFLKAAQKKGWDVSGMEPSEKARNLAAQKNIILENDFSAFSDNSFDVISMWHVLEHVPNFMEYLEKVKSLLKANGLLVIAVPNFESYDAKYYKEFWAAYDVPRHLYHFSPAVINEISTDKGFKLRSQKGLFFDAFYVSLLSEKYKTGSSNFLQAFKVAALSNFKAKTTGNYSSMVYFLQKK